MLLTQCGLSWREHDVFCLLSLSHTAKEVAIMLNLSVHTVITYRNRINSKLKFSGRKDFKKFLIENNLRAYCFSVEQKLMNKNSNCPLQSDDIHGGDIQF